MESFGGFRFNDMNKNVKKKRSNPSRRPPRNDTPPDNGGNSSLSTLPPSHNVSKGSSDENTGCVMDYHRKELNLNTCSTRASYTDLTEPEKALKISGETGTQGLKESKASGAESRRSSEGALAPTTRDHSGQSEVASDGKVNDTNVKRLKLKVGGMVRTLHAKSTSDAVASGESSSMKSSCFYQKPTAREKSNKDHSHSPDERSGLRGIPWKDFSRSGFVVGKVDSSRRSVAEESFLDKKSDKYEPIRKSKRVSKRQLLDGASSDVDDDEIRYLEKLKTSKTAACVNEFDDEDEPGSRKRRKISKVLSRSVGVCYTANVGSYGSSRSGKESHKSKAGRECEDSDYVDEEEHMSDREPEVERKKQRKELVDMAVTTRQRALQTGREDSSCSSAGLIEFPNGLPPAPPRKQKDKLSEVELQLKKAEAAQRRKIQNEKAARESEAEAIRKILGQDSSRKKQENKFKQRQEEIAQERTANAVRLASNTVRWVIGPTGTVVTFPDDMGLPTIFQPKTCCYPPPREKCAGPSCSNPYKYRDSRSKLPLCSLQCYKAVHEKMQPVTAC